MLRAWRGQHGNWCPGYQRDAHPASDLTADHIVPLAAGGAPFDIANCAVLCRSCNSTKGAGDGDRGYPHADSAPLEDRFMFLLVGFFVRFAGPPYAALVTQRRINLGALYELAELAERKLGAAVGLATVATVIANLATILGTGYVSWVTHNPLPLIVALPVTAYTVWSVRHHA